MCQGCWTTQRLSPLIHLLESYAKTIRGNRFDVLRNSMCAVVLVEGLSIRTQAQCAQVTSPLLTALSSAPLVFSSTLLGPGQALAGLVNDRICVSVGLGRSENG
jgi:hypothetical protein